MTNGNKPCQDFNRGLKKYQFSYHTAKTVFEPNVESVGNRKLIIALIFSIFK